jgi:hypothetical protein
MLPQEYAAGFAKPAASALLAFYHDAGFIGVAIGMAIYGLITRSIYEYYRRWSHTLYAQLLLAMWTPLMATAMRDGFTDTVDRTILVIGPIWIIYRLAATGLFRRITQRIRPLSMPDEEATALP